MNRIESELQGLESLYHSLEGHLEDQYQDLLSRKLPSPDRERTAADMDGQIRAWEKRLAELVSGGAGNASKTATERTMISARTSSLRERAQHLLELIARNAAQWHQLQSAAQSALQELQRGGQFLQSVGGYRENRPRFVDSRQ
jgi:flagellar hook-associated protein FlgK